MSIRTSLTPVNYVEVRKLAFLHNIDGIGYAIVPKVHDSEKE